MDLDYCFGTTRTFYIEFPLIVFCQTIGAAHKLFYMWQEKWNLSLVVQYCCNKPFYSYFDIFTHLLMSQATTATGTGNLKTEMIKYGHFQRSRALKNSGVDVLLLFFMTLVNFVTCLFVVECFPALQLLSSTFIYHGEKAGPRKVHGKKKGAMGGGRTNVAAANGFIGMIPVINFFPLPLKKTEWKKKGWVKGEEQPQSVTGCLNK